MSNHSTNAKILVTGGDGNLAQALYKLDNSIELSYRRFIDITDRGEVEVGLYHSAPDIVIHCAAMTKPMQRHEENPELSIETNIIGTANVAMECHEKGIRLVYISTDYVYPGTEGMYSETDGLNPVNAYAWTKLGGECAVQIIKNSLILRSSIVERPFVHDKAFTDLYKSCIYMDDAAKIILGLAKSNHTGVINVGGPATTMYDFVKQEQPDIGKISRHDIDEYIPPDVTLNTLKLERLWT